MCSHFKVCSVHSSQQSKILKFLCFFFSWPELKPLHTINAHPANCICIEFDPKGR